jgi:hypothetical protein
VSVNDESAAPRQFEAHATFPCSRQLSKMTAVSPDPKTGTLRMNWTVYIGGMVLWLGLGLAAAALYGIIQLANARPAGLSPILVFAFCFSSYLGASPAPCSGGTHGERPSLASPAMA